MEPVESVCVQDCHGDELQLYWDGWVHARSLNGNGVAFQIEPEHAYYLAAQLTKWADSRG